MRTGSRRSGVLAARPEGVNQRLGLRAGFWKERTMNIEFPEHQASDASAMLALIRLSDDAPAAEARLRQLVRASQEADAATERAKAATAEASEAQRKAEVAIGDLTTRVSEFQAWSTSTTASLTAREAAVLQAEAAAADCERQLKNRAADLDQRATEHANLMKRLRAHLDEFLT
jgi:chromosome segregation ATPase